MKTRLLIIIGVAAILPFVGFSAVYQFFESNNNETYCNFVSSKFCNPNPLETILQNPENTDTDRMTEFSKMMKQGGIDGFSFSSDGFSISSDSAMIKDMYFENPDAPVLTISLEFFKSGVITMTNPIHLIRSEFPDQSFSSLLITINENPIVYDELSHDRIAFKLEDFSEIILIQGLP